MLKERFFWIGLIIVVCSMIGNYLYFQSKQLTLPIFLKHYYETQVYEDGNQLQFYYLNNKENPVDVSYVSIDGVLLNPVNVPKFPTSYDENYRPNIEQNFTHHTLESVNFRFPEYAIPVKVGSDDVWTFNNMKVTFTNGKTIDVNIGEVRVYGKPPANEALNNTYSSSSNQNFSQWYAAATKPLTIEGISTPFSNQIGTDLFIKLFAGPDITTQDDMNTFSQVPKWYNDEFLSDVHLEDLEGTSLNEELFPIHLNESDFIKLYIYFNPESSYIFDFYITVYGSTDDGEPFEYAVPINASNAPYLKEDDVNKLIEERMGGLNK
ncbi:hypothetical protein ACOQFO_09490 [Ureibacillus sp. MALMAid1270]|uniref:hypothetical protein n=1 Tax=Ureibacillus sp. MALMAid1270 TaxID=3411629 RepID=UPI003BA5D19F